MKKSATLVFVVILATLLACSCGNSGSNANNQSNGNPTTGTPDLSGPFEITITGSSDLSNPRVDNTELIETNFASQGNGKYSFSPNTIMLELFGQMPQQWVAGTEFGIVNGNCAIGTLGSDNVGGDMQVTGNNLSGTFTDGYAGDFSAQGTFSFTGTWSSNGAFNGTWTASSTGQASCGGSGTFVAKPAENITGNYQGSLETSWPETSWAALIQGDGTGSATAVFTKGGSQVVTHFAGTQIANYMRMTDTSNPGDIRTIWYDTANDRLWVTWAGGPSFWGYLTH